MEKQFNEKIKTLKVLKSKNDHSREVIKLDSLFKDDFTNVYFSKKDNAAK
tara:strand:- start:22808 stop:22957 length:150 start_codon:yes stop_codon:yes gene_type:complete